MVAVALGAFVGGSLLAWLGYSMIMPVLIWFAPKAGGADFHSRAHEHFVLRCGRGGSRCWWPVWSPCSIRLCVCRGSSVCRGVSREDFAMVSADPGALLTGVSLGVAGVVGVVLMLGLVQRWGCVFPGGWRV